MAHRGERRQVTALFYDLVGSTQLAGRLDPEDLDELQQSFHEACARAIAEHGGNLQQLAGDGGLALFGFPIADEDAARQAVRAGLAIVSACRSLGAQGGSKHTLQVRVGVATGEVVIAEGRLPGLPHQSDIVGLAPNLAARLQAAADPDMVLVADTTARLTKGHFEYVSVGPLVLKGFTAPQAAWRAEKSVDIEDRFSAGRTSAPRPIVGRDEEIDRIRRLWTSAQSGNGQAVLISGESGIGKSRLIAAVRQAIGVEDHTRLMYQCLPQRVNTALHPVIAQLERVLDLSSHEPDEAVFDRLEELLRQSSDQLQDHAAAIAHLLELAGREARYGTLKGEPSQIRERILATLVAQLEGLSRRRPVLLVFEDVHWIDPTTLELLDQLIETLAGLRVLAVVSYRPEFAPPWVGRPHVTGITLNRLSEADSRQLVLEVAAGRPLLDSVVDEILAKSDGVPLFLEEVTAAALEGSFVERLSPDRRAPVSQVPAALSDSLMARLDRLGSEKHIVRLASALGRSFSVRLLQQVAGVGLEQLQAALGRLVSLGIATVRGQGPDAVYAFKHALIQEAAYGGMLRRERQDLHRRIADVLRDAFAGTRDAGPEILAFHLERGALPAEAISCLQEAARRAANRSANREAARLLEWALRLLHDLAPGYERDVVELQLLAALGPVLIGLSGPGAPDVKQLYAKGVALSAQVQPDPSHFPIYFGWWRSSSNFQEMRDRASRLVAFTQGLNDLGLELQAHHCQWATLYMLGDHQGCCRHIERGLALYESGNYRQHGTLYGGHDPKVCALAEHALSLWLQGYPTRAIGELDQCRAHAETLRHHGSIMHAMDATIMLYRFLGDVARLRESARETALFAREHGFPDLAAKADIFAGWAEARLGDPSRGADQIEAGLNAQRAIGTEEDFPVYYEMLAEVCGLMKKPRRGLPLVEDALATAEKTGLGFWSAELHRRRGELLIQCSARNKEDAIACFLTSVQIATAQNARSLSLRAHISLLGVLERVERRRMVLNDLSRLYGSFTEGHDTPDLIAVKRLLDAPPT